jgi:hypothetical protein
MTRIHGPGKQERQEEGLPPYHMMPGICHNAAFARGYDFLVWNFFAIPQLTGSR